MMGGVSSTLSTFVNVTMDPQYDMIIKKEISKKKRKKGKRDKDG
jgi:hypothetical protein